MLNRISDAGEHRCVSLARFLDELRPHIPYHWKNPAGFLTDFAPKFASQGRGSSTTRPATVPLPVKETPRCSRCRGVGRVDGGYCDSSMGSDLGRVERRKTPASVPADATANAGGTKSESPSTAAQDRAGRWWKSIQITNQARNWARARLACGAHGKVPK